MVKSIDIEKAKELMPKRVQNSNKATFGKVLNIAGSKCYQGAAYLSSIAAMLVGAGYSTLACPDCIINNIAALSPNLTFLPLRSFNTESIASDNAKLILEKAEEYDVISLGCGISTTSSTLEFVGTFLEKYKGTKPLLIDADGLNAISILEIKKLPQNTLITPHPKELARLLGDETIDINSDREFYAKEAVNRFGVTVLLKGQNTVITDGSNTYINKTGNSALAKAGTGDVLTGIISGLIAQKLTILDAALLGAFIHGITGEIASEKLTEYSSLASNLLDFIPEAIKKLT